jgi:hypothetical protein
MFLDGLVLCCRGPRCGATRRAEIADRWPRLVLLASLMMACSAAQAAEFEEVSLPSLPWSALPDAKPGAHPLKLDFPRIPVEAEGYDFAPSDPILDQSAIGTTLWSGDSGSLSIGFSINQEVDKNDRMWGLLRKRYTAVFAFDQPLGFSTALIVDVLSKDKRRGQKEFKILQVAVSRPFADGGNLTAGTALMLDGLNPELTIGVRLFLPLNGP